MLVRPVLLWLLAGLALAGPAAAALPDPQATIFTLAGAGTAKPADGVPAAQARLDVLDLQPLPDGELVVVLRRTSDGPNVFRIDTAGILHALPPERVTAVTLEPDGMLAAVGQNSREILQLDPAGGPATALTSIKTREGELTDVAALTDGELVVTDGDTVERVAPDGSATPAYPDSKLAPSLVSRLAGLPDGTFALIDGDRGIAKRVAADGTFTDLGVVKDVVTEVDTDAITALPDGQVLLGEAYAGGLIALGPDATGQATIPADGTGLGIGDGGPLATAQLARTAPTTLAVDAAGDLLTGSPDGIRIVPASPVTTPLAALAPAGYTGLRTGTATLLTTTAGTATVTLKGPGGTRTSTPQAVPAGGGPVTLRAPTPGAYDVTVSFTDAATGRLSVSRTTVDTRTTLRRKLAFQTIETYLESQHDGDEQETIGVERGRCSRTRTTVSCLLIDVTTDRDDHGRHAHTTKHCGGRIEITLAPDGLRRDTSTGKHACRR